MRRPDVRRRRWCPGPTASVCPSYRNLSPGARRRVVAGPASAAAARRPRPGRSRHARPAADAASWSLRCADTVVRRSSTYSTGTGATSSASCVAVRRGPSAAEVPPGPRSVRGSPTTTPTASYSRTSAASSDRSRAARGGRGRSVATGTASTPRGSLRATPTRTVPTSTPNQTPVGSGVSAARAQARRGELGAHRGERVGQLARRRRRRPARGRPCRRRARRAPARRSRTTSPAASPASCPASFTAATNAAPPVSFGEASSTTAGSAAAQPAAHVQGQRAQVVAADARRAPRPRPAAPPPTCSACSASAPAPASTCADPQLRQLPLGGLEPVEHAGDALGQLVRLGLELAGQRLDEHVLAGEVPERVQPDQRLDAAHARADRRLAEQLDHADDRAARHVRAAAQLARVVADLDDAHLVAVLLAEHRDRAEPPRLVLVGDEPAHLEVAQQHLVDLVLDVAEHAVRHGAGRGEVEAQPAGRVERAGLRGRVAERAAQPGVQQVRGRVAARHGRPPVDVDLRQHVVAGAHLAGQHGAAVRDQARAAAAARRRRSARPRGRRR